MTPWTTWAWQFSTVFQTTTFWQFGSLRKAAKTKSKRRWTNTDLRDELERRQRRSGRVSRNDLRRNGPTLTRSETFWGVGLGISKTGAEAASLNCLIESVVAPMSCLRPAPHAQRKMWAREGLAMRTNGYSSRKRRKRGRRNC